MNPLGRASMASVAEVNNADPKAALSRKQSGRRKRRSFPQKTMEKDDATDFPIAQSAPEPTGISRIDHRPVPRFHSETARNFVDLHKSQIQDCGVDSGLSLLKLDDICRYGISTCQEAKLWELEITRLATANDTKITTNPLRSAVQEEWLPDHAGFEILSNVTAEIIRNLIVCDFDNQIALLGCQHELFDSKRLSVAREAVSAGRQTSRGGGKILETSQTKPTLPTEQRRKFYCALVDYITVVVARCVSYNVDDRSWHAFRMTSLARFAAKLKFLAIDSEQFVSQSLNNEQKVLALGSVHAGKVDTGSFAQNFSASCWVQENLLDILSSLNREKKPGVLKGFFGIGIIIYDAGWENLPIIVGRDQDGEISGTHMQSSKWGIRGAFETLVQVFSTTEAGLANPRQSIHPSSADMWMQLEYENGPSKRSDTKYSSRYVAKLETMADVVACMVPLLVMQPNRLLRLNRRSDLFTEMSFDTNEEHISSSFGVEAKLPAFAQLRSSLYDSDVSSLSGMRDLLAEGSGPHPRKWYSNLETLPVKSTARATTDSQSLNIQTWAIEEKSIIVARRLYVTITMAVCGVLVVGGILAGLLVGERIPGVDPFNIATFAWVIAAFIILIAKSLSVREWPWRDFLRGQVPCRSVSELHTVTGVDEQRILKYLLTHDANLMLTTRGPFNPFFTRRSDDGFSIDVKMNLHTVVSSGILLVRVSTGTSAAFVCLDLRRGVEGRTSIRHFDRPREGERDLGVYDFPEGIGHNPDIIIRTLPHTMTWARVLGVYAAWWEPRYVRRSDVKFR